MPKKLNSQIIPSLSTNNTFLFAMIFCIFILVLFIAIYIYDIYSSQKTTYVYVSEEAESYQDLPIIKIVYTYSKTCPHCIKFEETYDLVAKAFAKNLTSHQVEVSKVERANIPENYMKMIDGFPTVLVFIDNELKGKSVGNKNSADFSAFLENILNT